MPDGVIDPRYGDSSASAPPWAEVDALLKEAQRYWMVTVRRDGRPHTVPLVGVWREGAFAFCTGPEEQKQRNLDSNPRVAVSASTGAPGWDVGTDAVIEGTAVRVTDPADLQSLADAWQAKYGQDWLYDVRGAEFVERSRSGAGGGGGAWVFRVVPEKVLLFGGDHGQTAYRF